MGNRLIQSKLRVAREKVEDNLKLAIKHPSFEEKFMAQAIAAEILVAQLRSKL